MKTSLRESQVGWARKLIADTNETFETISAETGLPSTHLTLLENGILDPCNDAEAAAILSEIPNTATEEEALILVMSLVYWY